MSDKYDEAIAYLAEHPNEIEKAWQNFEMHPAGCLFMAMTPDGNFSPRDDGENCGCPTMIVQRFSLGPVAWTDELTEAIRNDPRLPGKSDEITLISLPAFADHQRSADKEIRQPAEMGSEA